MVGATKESYFGIFGFKGRRRTISSVAADHLWTTSLNSVLVSGLNIRTQSWNGAFVSPITSQVIGKGTLASSQR